MFIIIIIYMNKILAVMSPELHPGQSLTFPIWAVLATSICFTQLLALQQEDTSSSFTTQTLRKHALRSRRGGSGPLPAQTGRIRKSFYGVLTNVQHGAGECQRL